VQKQITLRAAPATVLPPQIAIPAPAPVTLPAAPWVDIVGQLDPAVGGAVTQRTVRIAHPGVELSEVKKELSELRASVDRIEKLLRKDEE
jgi:hypothetical protein